jgi:hypothetical protein
MSTSRPSPEKIAELQTLFELMPIGDKSPKLSVPSAEAIAECYEKHFLRQKAGADEKNIANLQKIGEKVEAGENPFDL